MAHRLGPLSYQHPWSPMPILFSFYSKLDGFTLALLSLLQRVILQAYYLVRDQQRQSHIPWTKLHWESLSLCFSHRSSFSFPWSSCAQSLDWPLLATLSTIWHNLPSSSSLPLSSVTLQLPSTLALWRTVHTALGTSSPLALSWAFPPPSFSYIVFRPQSITVSSAQPLFWLVSSSLLSSFWCSQ